jgi:hypothetical protein
MLDIFLKDFRPSIRKFANNKVITLNFLKLFRRNKTARIEEVIPHPALAYMMPIDSVDLYFLFLDSEENSKNVVWKLCESCKSFIKTGFAQDLNENEVSDIVRYGFDIAYRAANNLLWRLWPDPDIKDCMPMSLQTPKSINNFIFDWDDDHPENISIRKAVEMMAAYTKDTDASHYFVGEFERRIRIDWHPDWDEEEEDLPLPSLKFWGVDDSLAGGWWWEEE